MDGALALLIIPLLLAGLILVILNLLDVDISLSRNTSEISKELEKKVDEHEVSTSHLNMLHADHNSSVAAHLNFDDKYMSSSAVTALIDEVSTSSSHKELLGSIVSSSIDSQLESTFSEHNSSNEAHNLDIYSGLGTDLGTLQEKYNSHTHDERGNVSDGDKLAVGTFTDNLNWTPV